MLPTVLFVVFTLLAAAGAFLIGDHFRSRATGVIAAVLVVAFMAALYGYVMWLIRSAGV